MSCSNATSPIDLSKQNIKSDCNRLCKYEYDYPDSSTTIRNLGLYLKLTYDKFSPVVAPVLFNNINMNVDEIRIFKPSLHTFSGNHAKGEIIIKHSGNGDNLLVCIPMIIENSNSKGSKILDEIMEKSKDKIPNSPDVTTVNIQNFTLNDFIKKKKPFFSYKGTQPYKPCNDKYNLIVFDLDSAFKVNPSTFSIIDKLISNQEYSIKKDNNFFYNRTGALKKGSGETDEYYLECNPTGSEGNILYAKDLNSGDSTEKLGGLSVKGSGNAINFLNPAKNPFIAIFYGFILFFIIYKIIEYNK